MKKGRANSNFFCFCFLSSLFTLLPCHQFLEEHSQRRLVNYAYRILILHLEKKKRCTALHPKHAQKHKNHFFFKAFNYLIQWCSKLLYSIKLSCIILNLSPQERGCTYWTFYELWLYVEELSGIQKLLWQKCLHKTLNSFRDSGYDSGWIIRLSGYIFGAWKG